MTNTLFRQRAKPAKSILRLSFRFTWHYAFLLLMLLVFLLVLVAAFVYLPLPKIWPTSAQVVGAQPATILTTPRSGYLQFITPPNQQIVANGQLIASIEQRISKSPHHVSSEVEKNVQRAILKLIEAQDNHGLVMQRVSTVQNQARSAQLESARELLLQQIAIQSKSYNDIRPLAQEGLIAANQLHHLKMQQLQLLDKLNTNIAELIELYSQHQLVGSELTQNDWRRNAEHWSSLVTHWDRQRQREELQQSDVFAVEAPIAGQLSSLSPRTGDFISAGTALAIIEPLQTHWYVELELPAYLAYTLPIGELQIYQPSTVVTAGRWFNVQVLHHAPAAINNHIFLRASLPQDIGMMLLDRTHLQARWVYEEGTALERLLERI